MKQSGTPSGWTASALAFAAAATLAVTGCAGMESTPEPGAPSPLDKTYWRLVTVNDASVPPGSGRHEAHLQFDPEKKRVTGYSGVNIFSGGYDVTGSRLRMSHMASTRRAGTPQLMKLETTYLKALSATRSYRVDGDMLELLNVNGQVVARFEGQKKP